MRSASRPSHSGCPRPAQQLRELADALGQAGDELAGADGRHAERDGSTTSTVLGVARWNGRRLGKDAALLTELGRGGRARGPAARRHPEPRPPCAATALGAGPRRLPGRDARCCRRVAAGGQQAARSAEHGGGQGHGGQGHGAQGQGGQNQAWQDRRWTGSAPARAGRPRPDAAHRREPAARVRRAVLAAAGFTRWPEVGAATREVRPSWTHAASRPSRRTARPCAGCSTSSRRSCSRCGRPNAAIEEREVFPRTERDDDEGSEAVMLAAGGLVSASPVLRELVKDLRYGARRAATRHETVAVISHGTARRSAAGPFTGARARRRLRGRLAGPLRASTRPAADGLRQGRRRAREASSGSTPSARRRSGLARSRSALKSSSLNQDSST